MFRFTYVIHSLGIIISLVSVGLVDAADQPNIVFILADDMGYGDLKPFNSGSKISAPHLEKLAADGMCFKDAHAGGSTCKPSRYSLITGRFAARKDNFNDKQPIIAAGRSTIASMLRERGYHTEMVGKWHLGFDRKATVGTQKRAGGFDFGQAITGGPLDRGFDSFFGMHASLDIPPYFYMRDRKATLAADQNVEASTSVGGTENWNKIQGAFWRAGNIAPDFQHTEVTPRFAEEACRVIETHDQNEPLFLYVALPSPHTPWLPAEEFRGKSGAGMYGDFVTMVDHHIGRILTSLDKNGLSENTLVMFSSDNGPVWYDKDTEKFGHRSVGPLRGIKASAWEGGHRVPFIARWPGHIKPGSTSQRTIAFADVYATCAAVAGDRDIPQPDQAEDSVSFLPALLGSDQPPRPPILHGERVIRDGDWKLINTKGSRGFSAERKKQYPIALYNLKDDLSESNNLANDNPEKVAELRTKIRDILEPAAGSAATDSTQNEKWIPLFNGRNLDGWKANAHPESFSVENGLLKAHGRKGMSHLFLVDESGKDIIFRDFELIAITKSEPNSNSGIFFHTSRELRGGKYLNKGYEVQLNSSKKEKRKTGSLYAVVNVDKSPVDETDWFELHVRVQGKRITVSINGKPVVDYTEPANPKRPRNRAKRLIDPNGGAIAIQAHDPKSVFYFREIRIRKL